MAQLIVKLWSVLCFYLLAGKSNAEKEWVVGYEKLNGTCEPVGGMTVPGVLPFPYESLDDCKNGTLGGNFNNSLPIWEGFVLESDFCLKVWARADFNPFSLTESACEKERQTMKAALSNLEGSGVGKRAGLDIDAMSITKTYVEMSFTAISMVFPPAGFLMPILNLFWPSNKPDVWTQVRAKVKRMINQHLNQHFADELKDFLSGLHTEFKQYSRMRDTSDSKFMKLVAIDTQLGTKEPRFMYTKKPLTTLTYFVPYITLRFAVKVELIRMSKQNEDKKYYAEQYISLSKKYTPILGDMTYDFYRWRVTAGTECKFKEYTRSRSYRYDYYLEYTDKIDSSYSKKAKIYDAIIDGNQWCASQASSLKREVNAFITSLRGDIQALGSMFNIMATNPLLENTDLDLTSCKLTTRSGEQYFGHKNVAKSGKKCMEWIATDVKATSFVMDNKNKTLAGNYCRGFDDPDPWCYTAGLKKEFCDVSPCNPVAASVKSIVDAIKALIASLTG